ncbi:AraC family transcriptional regulator [Caenimonas sp. S4]|nr:AraC family transcriptional regulator [Caenimonas soli]
MEEYNLRCGSWHFPETTVSVVLCYVASGQGVFTTDDGEPVRIECGTLVLVPAGSRGKVLAINARDDCAEGLRLILCEFEATFGEAIELFAGVRTVIVERFDQGQALGHQLDLALDETRHDYPGQAVMISLLIKQVLLLLLRRGLTSAGSWVELLATLRDPRISRAFVAMSTRPGAVHTVESLAGTACLSRSGFMARFCEVFGRSPMSVLRDLRMRQAALQLRTTTTPIGLIGKAAGYSNNGGFIRAFRRAYDVEPREYREQSTTTRREPSAHGARKSYTSAGSQPEFTVLEDIGVQ